MITFLVILHIIVCFALIVIVLLQKGRGAEIGAVFGGTTQTIFGGRTAATILTKITAVAAIVFMITSFMLTYHFSRKANPKSVVDVPTREQRLPTGQQVPLEGEPSK
uniref:Preprotein translocase subunit SecG n=1 Tax=uncultured prokaryote TaxID=198431 RepID=H5SEK9_9ZZZZ|nr:preprotein translocase subunit SecG [uncultured prokaryote]